MRLPFVLVLLLTVAVHGAEPAVPPTPAAAMGASYAKVALADGVDEAEAAILASEYFVRFISGCGGASAPVLADGRWVFTTLEGWGARPGPVVTVDRSTGIVSCPDHPTVTPVVAAGARVSVTVSDGSCWDAP